MTYARARLWLGISGVGLFVMLAAWGLASGFSVSSVLPFLALYLLIHLPLDILGGYWLPLSFARWPGGRFWPRYLRGALLHAGFLLVVAWMTPLIGRQGGLVAVLVFQLLLMVALVGWQDQLAVWMSGAPSATADPGFTGGIAGLPGAERLVLPRDPTIKNFTAVRRRACIASGSRLRGLLVAIIWNLAGFAASAHLPGAGVTNHTELLRTVFGFTLWSFLGLLILPSLSRRGVLEVDQAVRRLGIPPAVFAQAIQTLDRLQDDEPQRAPGVETIFHPIPSVTNRMAGFAQPSSGRGAWHAARYALFLSWPGLGLLSRAVHCNVGRPELWVFLPAD